MRGVFAPDFLKSLKNPFLQNLYVYFTVVWV